VADDVGARPDAPAGSPVVASLLLAMAVGAYAVSFGVLAVQAGLTTAQTCVMSLLVFTGASQFAAVGVISSGGSPYAALGSALLLAARNAVYGLAMSQVLPEGRVRRLVAAQFVIDESTAMALAQREPRRRIEAFWATGLGIYVFWNLGTLIGAVVGDRLSDPAALGLDAAFPAGFVALLVPHLRKPGGRTHPGAAGRGADPARGPGGAARSARGAGPMERVAPMSWWTVVALGFGAYGLKVLGLVVLGGRSLPPRLRACVDLLPAALLPALVVVNTFATDRHLVLDARAAGMGAAAVAAWRRAPLPVVIVLGAVVTALVRRWG
jgi:4-azaleucine resistance transporter AzlC